PVIEALRHGRQVQKIYIQHGNQSGSIRQIYRMARDLKIPVSNADARKLR
ncbi:MAG: 23S rRNA (guanosine(2251)-2'-O)-methyltransferase RlmB, partial [Calditrichaeota bacterium]|nr:23S rRNA (guanosine(2251)-2'-O)-methyltransferase RlmB [Calditrichota bacterium]